MNTVVFKTISSFFSNAQVQSNVHSLIVYYPESFEAKVSQVWLEPEALWLSGSQAKSQVIFYVKTDVQEYTHL